MLHSRPIRLAVLLSTCVGLLGFALLPAYAQGVPTPPGAVPALQAPALIPALVAPAEPTALPPSVMASPKPAVSVNPGPIALGPVIKAEPNKSADPPTGQAPTATLKPKPPALLKLAAVSKDPRPTLGPETFISTLRAADRYRQIAEAGGWPRLPTGITLKIGDKGPVVAQVGQHLSVTSDLPSDIAPGDVFDGKLAAAVKLFQARHGLPKTGLVGPKTVQAMNVSAEIRFRQLAQSALRISGSRFPFGECQVVANIASAAVEAVQDG